MTGAPPSALPLQPARSPSRPADTPQRQAPAADHTSAGGVASNPKQKRSGYVRDPLDWFVEPDWCTKLLLQGADFESVWDPACGSNTIVRVLRDHGVFAWGSDIAVRGYEDGAPVDFLKSERLPAGLTDIVTNPPYKIAEMFARRALEELRARKTAILVRLDFLASQGRHRLFIEHPPASVFVLSRRPSMPPGELLMRGDVKPTSGQHDYCWIVWDREHRGATRMKWLK